MASPARPISATLHHIKPSLAYHFVPKTTWRCHGLLYARQNQNSEKEKKKAQATPENGRHLNDRHGDTERLWRWNSPTATVLDRSCKSMSINREYDHYPCWSRRPLTTNPGGNRSKTTRQLAAGTCSTTTANTKQRGRKMSAEAERAAIFAW